MSSSAQNVLARTLKSLHKPGSPIILTNAWDAISARTIASLPGTKALASASYGVAAAAGLDDQDLDLETNLRAAAAIARVAKEYNKPLTVDFQDGFSDKLEDGIRRLVKIGAVGINLEDFGRELGGTDGKGALYEVKVAQERIRRVMKIAGEEGVPDFVVNARTDALITGLSVDDAIARGKAYLEAGASNVFIWGGGNRGGWSRAEVEKAAKELNGKLNVTLKLAPGWLTVKELSGIGGVGVARISVGPQIMARTQAAVKGEAERILKGERY